MAKIKLTKTELKAQRDALKQFSRFLPTLQLKKQQLQMELRKSQQLLDDNRAKLAKFKQSLDSWIGLFGDEQSVDFISGHLKVLKIDCGISNIAGVKVPVFKAVEFEVIEYDLFTVDLWIDDGIECLKKLVSLETEYTILEQQYKLLEQELRTTTQRVNLFEKVKIPECKENIRVIQIYLGDMDTAAVARSKIAKGKSQEVAA